MHRQKHKNIIRQKGATAILLSVLVLSSLLVIGLGYPTLIIIQLKMSRAVKESTQAFYAADAGAELCLYQIKKGISEGCFFTTNGGNISGTLLVNGATYSAESQKTGPTWIINSLGQYGSTSRKIFISWGE